LLAKSLKTGQEDVHRTLATLIIKVVVSSSLEIPMVYTAVDLGVALDVALKKRESELRELERKKQEFQEISKQQGFSPSDEFPTFKIIKSIKESLLSVYPL
jgi:sugar-specific transcriptional regulator TrmB